MNNAKMWLVVNPSVGVPIFLGAVAVGSFAVHVAVLSNTSWVSDFLSGVPLGTGDEVASSTAVPSAETSNAAYVLEQNDGSREVTVILKDGTLAKAVLKANEVVASTAAAPRVALE